MGREGRREGRKEKGWKEQKEREKERRKGREEEKRERVVEWIDRWMKQTLLQFSETLFLSCTGVVLQESVQSQGSMASNEMTEVYGTSFPGLQSQLKQLEGLVNLRRGMTSGGRSEAWHFQ